MKKAFTLIETIVTLSVVSIVFVLISSLVIAISNVTKRQQYQTLCQDEYFLASSAINSFFSAYSLDGFIVLQAQENMLTVSNGQDEYVTEYNQSNKLLQVQVFNYKTNQTDTINLQFENLIKISFDAQDNIVLCSYEFANFHTYTELKKLGAY